MNLTDKCCSAYETKLHTICVENHRNSCNFEEFKALSYGLFVSHSATQAMWLLLEREVNENSH